MKVSLAITTCNQPQRLQSCLQSIEANNIKLHKLFIHDDVNKKGVAYSKNKCLQAINDSDIMILIDDDVLIQSPEAIDFIAQGHELSRQHHFLFMDKKHHEYVRTWQPTHDISIDLFNKCSGVFMSITKEAFNTVGYFDSRYYKYGYEHAGYTRRIHLSRLNAHPFMMLTGMDRYIKALDFEGNIDSALNDELKNEYSKVGGQNDMIYHDELKQWYNLKRDFNE